MKILKNMGLIMLSITLSLLTYSLSGNVFLNIFPEEGGGWINTSGIIKFAFGLPLAFLFFLSLLFTAFGDQHKYRWIGIASLPALAFLVYFDFSHIYFHLLFPLVGWLIGKCAGKLFGHPTAS